MKYPVFLKDNDTIGLIAPSLASNVNPYRIRLQEGIKYFENKGYTLKRGNHLFTNVHAASDTSEKRAKDFVSFYTNKNVDFVWSIGGGEIMVDILEHIDFAKIAASTPKWYAGYSDNTNITFLLTTLCDVASFYCMHIGDFSTRKLHKQNDDLYKLFRGERFTFTNYDSYEREDNKSNDPLEPLNLKYKTEYKSMNMENVDSFSGRMIGGCLDIITILCGTKFDKVDEFLEKYKKDGFIWYLDSCDYASVGFYRALMQLKYANYFKYAKGILIGRTANTAEPFDFTFKEAIESSIKSLNIPIIYDVDIGHIPPSIPVINGAIAKVQFKDKKFKIKYELK